jgi:hypothetical protein
MSAEPRDTPFDPVADAARGYHELLYRMDAFCSLRLCDRDWEPGELEPISERYLQDVAPRCAEIERLAATDRLLVNTFTAFDGMSLTWGFLEATTVAVLRLPKGERHPEAGPATVLSRGREIDERWFEDWGPNSKQPARAHACAAGSTEARRRRASSRPTARSMARRRWLFWRSRSPHEPLRAVEGRLKVATAGLPAGLEYRDGLLVCPVVACRRMISPWSAREHWAWSEDGTELLHCSDCAAKRVPIMCAGCDEESDVYSATGFWEHDAQTGQDYCQECGPVTPDREVREVHCNICRRPRPADRPDTWVWTMMCDASGCSNYGAL